MSLCIRCGKVSEHAKGCADAAPEAFDSSPAARNERALAAHKQAQAELEAAQPLVESKPRDAAKALFQIEGLLTRHPASDLTSFEHKRKMKTVEESVAKLKVEVLEKLGAKGAEIFADLAYTKRSLELLHAVHFRRREISSIKLDELTQVPGLGFNPQEANDPTDPGALVKGCCETIEKRLAATSSNDFDVDQWGKSYVESLSLGEAPREFPSRLNPSLVVPQALLGLGVVGLGLAGAIFQVKHDPTLAGAVGGFAAVDLVISLALFGRAVGARKQIPQQFENLSQSCRLRLYLVAADRSLRRYVSSLSQAEEALRTHTSGDHAARWKRIKTQERDLVKALAGAEWDEKHTVDEEMARRIGLSNLVEGDSIRSANGLSRDFWETFGKAYFLNRREEGDANEAWLVSLSSAVLTRAGEREDQVAQRKTAASAVRGAFSGRATSERAAAEG